MQIQWLSHSVVKISTGTHTLLVDPFLTGNPKAPVTWQEAAEGVTHVLLTHGHGDHVGDTAAIVAQTGAKVVGMVELVRWLEKKHGVKTGIEANFGGTVDLGHGHGVTLVPAWHSSSDEEGHFLGTPAGLVIKTPTHTLYHAGDTCIFSDMALIAELYQPTVGFLPIGGKYTMDGPTAAIACRKFFRFEAIIPIHYGTFGALAPTAEAFIQNGLDLPIQPLQPGQTLSL